jgi:hypothetical protein
MTQTDRPLGLEICSVTWACEAALKSDATAAIAQRLRGTERDKRTPGFTKAIQPRQQQACRHARRYSALGLVPPGGRDAAVRPVSNTGPPA